MSIEGKVEWVKRADEEYLHITYGEKKSPLWFAYFKIEKMLGRPIKKYNALVIKDGGQHFSSSNDPAELHQYVKYFDYLAVCYYNDIIAQQGERHPDKSFFFGKNNGNDETWKNMTIGADEFAHFWLNPNEL